MWCKEDVLDTHQIDSGLLYPTIVSNVWIWVKGKLHATCS